MTIPDLSRATWRKSARSGQNGNCVEVADVHGAVAVRDSKAPDGGVVMLPAGEWRALLKGIRAGLYGSA